MFPSKFTLINIFNHGITAWLGIQPRLKIDETKADSLFCINKFLVHEKIATEWR